MYYLIHWYTKFTDISVSFAGLENLDWISIDSGYQHLDLGVEQSVQGDRKVGQEAPLRVAVLTQYDTRSIVIGVKKLMVWHLTRHKQIRLDTRQHAPTRSSTDSDRTHRRVWKSKDKKELIN